MSSTNCADHRQRETIARLSNPRDGWNASRFERLANKASWGGYKVRSGSQETYAAARQALGMYCVWWVRRRSVRRRQTPVKNTTHAAALF